MADSSFDWNVLDSSVGTGGPIGSEQQGAAAIPRVSLRDLFFCFLQVGLTSFGGGTQAWVYRAVVEDRNWLDEKAFLAGLTVAQILPGANPVNLALYVGQRLRGRLGALVAALGMVVPAICVVLVVAAIYSRISAYPLTQFMLIGIATVGLGATFAAGTKAALRIERKPVTLFIGIATFAGVGVFHWSMVPVVAVLAPLSIFLALRRPGG